MIGIYGTTSNDWKPILEMLNIKFSVVVNSEIINNCSNFLFVPDYKSSSEIPSKILEKKDSKIRLILFNPRNGEFLSILEDRNIEFFEKEIGLLQLKSSGASQIKIPFKGYFSNIPSEFHAIHSIDESKFISITDRKSIVITTILPTEIILKVKPSWIITILREFLDLILVHSTVIELDTLEELLSKDRREARPQYNALLYDILLSSLRNEEFFDKPEIVTEEALEEFISIGLLRKEQQRIKIVNNACNYLINNVNQNKYPCISTVVQEVKGELG